MKMLKHLTESLAELKDDLHLLSNDKIGSPTPTKMKLQSVSSSGSSSSEILRYKERVIRAPTDLEGSANVIISSSDPMVEVGDTVLNFFPLYN
jgi:hypothetical protein